MIVAMARTMKLGIEDRKQATHIEPYLAAAVAARRHRDWQPSLYCPETRR